MSTFSGRQKKGARREAREMRRLEAESRNALTPPERRSRKVVARALLLDVFGIEA